MPRPDYERNSIFERLACLQCRRSWPTGYDSCPHCGAGLEQQASLPYPIPWGWLFALAVLLALSVVLLLLWIAG